MIELGSLCAALAVGLAFAWLASGSRLAANLAAVARASGDAPDRPSGIAAVGVTLGGARRIALRAAAACGVAVPLILSGVPLLAPVAGYAVFVVPGLVADRRAARALRDAERALVVAVEWIDALVAAGRPAELAVQAVAREGAGATLLDTALRNASTAALLGAPMFRVLALEARAGGLPALAALGDELERSRDLGRGSRVVLRETRDELRRGERARAIDAASRVDAKLMLVLVLCYLPALMLLVVVPLFVGLLSGILE